MPEHNADHIYMSQEIVASAFHPKNEMIVLTLTGMPELTLIMWQWDQGKILAKQSIGMRGLTATESQIPYQLSYNPMDLNCSKVLITGPSTYIYLKV
jgi:hypothetical protein